jgi:hypothetical protein
MYSQAYRIIYTFLFQKSVFLGCVLFENYPPLEKYYNFVHSKMFRKCVIL